MITRIFILNKFSVHLNEKLNIHKKSIDIANKLKDVNKKLKWIIENPKDIGIDDNLLLYYPKNSKKHRLMSHPLKRLEDIGKIDKYLEQTSNYLKTDTNMDSDSNIVDINIEEKKIVEVEIKEKIEKLKEKVNSIKIPINSKK